MLDIRACFALSVVSSAMVVILASWSLPRKTSYWAVVIISSSWATARTRSIRESPLRKTLGRGIHKWLVWRAWHSLHRVVGHLCLSPAALVQSCLSVTGSMCRKMAALWEGRWIEHLHPASACPLGQLLLHQSLCLTVSELVVPQAAFFLDTSLCIFGSHNRNKISLVQFHDHLLI